MLHPSDAWVTAISIALFTAEAARSVEITFLNAARRQRTMALLVMADAWLRPVTAVGLVLVLGAHDAAVLGGYLLGCLLTLAAYRLIARAPERVHVQGIVALPRLTEISNHLWKYALPLTALPLIGWISGQADRYLVGGIVSVAAAGLYAALYGLASKPLLMFSASVELALRQPYYTSASSRNYSAELRALVLWLATVTSVSLVLWLLFVLFHSEIAALMLAPEYRSYSPLMVWVAAGYLLLSMAQVFERVCYAHHDTRGVVWVEASGAVLNVVIAAPLIYAYGIEGAAWAVPWYFGGQLLIAAARAHRTWRRAAHSREVLPSSDASPTLR
jgi:O-antigen/teichoic acid export membrane protein